MLTTLAVVVRFVSATSDSSGMLDPDQLRSVDRAILGYLAEGRVTPAYARARLADEGVGDYSRGYVQQRLARFEEHSHAENLYGTGLYQLTNDPREDQDVPE
jgi:hypothetical protein